MIDSVNDLVLFYNPAALELLAEAAHEINRAYCMALGDTSQPPWAEAPDWQQTSALCGVRAVLQGGPDHTPEKSHEGWLARKFAEGWTYGPVKDPERKTHPCCVPYGELPESQRAKDYVFIAAVRQAYRILRASIVFKLITEGVPENP